MLTRPVRYSCLVYCVYTVEFTALSSLFYVFDMCFNARNSEFLAGRFNPNARNGPHVNIYSTGLHTIQRPEFV